MEKNNQAPEKPQFFLMEELEKAALDPKFSLKRFAREKGMMPEDLIEAFKKTHQRQTLAVWRLEKLRRFQNDCKLRKFIIEAFEKLNIKLTEIKIERAKRLIVNQGLAKKTEDCWEFNKKEVFEIISFKRSIF